MLCTHKKGNLSILIDTSPDIKNQILKNKIKSLDGLYTPMNTLIKLQVFRMRPFFWQNQKIPIYGSERTVNQLKENILFVLKEDTVINRL